MTKSFKAPLLATAILSSSFAFAGAAHGQAFYKKGAMMQHHLEAIVVAGVVAARYLYGAVHP